MSCTSHRLHCSATVGCTPHAFSACRPSRYSKRTSRDSPRVMASVSRHAPPGRGSAICTAAPTARWRLRLRRWKTLLHIVFRGCTSGRVGSTSLATRRRRATSSCAAGGRRTASRLSASSAGWPQRSTSSASRCWPVATTCRWSSSATAWTEPSSNLPCRPRFSPERSTASSSPPPTPAWMSSSIPASTRPSVRSCRRRWRRACRSSRPTPAGRGTWWRPCTPDCCCRSDEFESRLATSVDHLLAERQRYSVAARRSVLGRTWPAICDELIGHYEAVLGTRHAKAA